MPSASAETAELSDQQATLSQDEVQGLQCLERRLLTLLDQTPSDDQERRESLERSLAAVRDQQACAEIRISPQQAGAALRLLAEKAAERVAGGAAIQAADGEEPLACSKTARQ